MSTIHFVPTHSLELVEGVALRTAIEERILESRKPFENCIDVLSQYLVTLATGNGFFEEIIYHQVKSTYAYRNLNDEQWDWIMQFVTTGGKTLSGYDEFSKVGLFDGAYKVLNKRVAMRHRSSIGTIVGDVELKVKLQNGGVIGTIEEGFISRLMPGNVFSFAGKMLEYVKLKDFTVTVKLAKRKKGYIPQWGGGRMPLSSQLAALIRHKIELGGRGDAQDELKDIAPIFEIQKEVSLIPSKDTLLIESVHTHMGHHIFVYPFEGRAVHEIMAMICAERISKICPISCSVGMNDYGFELLSDEEIPIYEALELDLFSIQFVEQDIVSAVNKSEMAKRRFRDIAAIAGLVFQGFPGQKVHSKHIQASSGLIYNVLEEYDQNNLLLQQAISESLTFELEQDRLLDVMEHIEKQHIEVKELAHPSPFSFPILAESIRGRYSSENVLERIEKMQIELEGLVGGA